MISQDLFSTLTRKKLCIKKKTNLSRTMNIRIDIEHCTRYFIDWLIIIDNTLHNFRVLCLMKYSQRNILKFVILSRIFKKSWILCFLVWRNFEFLLLDVLLVYFYIDPGYALLKIQTFLHWKTKKWVL